ncbi:hypothetical protein SAMN03159297_01216 [Pseudomonas sp. NFACC45]|nr:hypothetical protein SAMN03159297_01216 [Pseudomonas sp. NFACC45]
MLEREMEAKQSLMDIATLDDFAHIGPSTILTLSNSLHFHTLERTFLNASQAAEACGDKAAVRAYNVLAVICSYHFNPDRPDTFTPQQIMDRQRTLIPSDFVGEQQEILVKIVEKVDHPLLRARIADSCWYMNRRLHEVAMLAAESYLMAVQGFFDKKLLHEYVSDFKVPTKITRLIERAFSIYASIGKRKGIPLIAKDTLSLAREIAIENNNLIAFYDLSLVSENYHLIGWDVIASEAESLAKANNTKQHADAVKKIWGLAAQAYNKLDDKESAKRCKVSAVDQTLRMRDGVSQSSAKAYWTKLAIGEYRSIKGMTEEIVKLKAELQILEEKSLDDLAEFSMPLDLSDIRQLTREKFENIEVHEMLFRLALIDKIPQKTALHTSCLSRRDRNFFSSMAGKTFADAQGKIIANSPSAPMGLPPPETWFDHESLVDVRFHSHVASEGNIRAACRAMCRHQQIDERHLMPVVSQSAFVPYGHEFVFALGFARLIQGDMISAAHLLIPQLENSLRFILENDGSNTAKLNIDLTQEDQSLSQLYSNQRKALENRLGIDITYMLHLLFNLKGGAMLRHEMAHGKLSSSDCYNPLCVYACWLMYHITCLPLLSRWNSQVAPAIRELAH